MEKVKYAKGFKWTLEEEQKLIDNYLIKTEDELLEMFQFRSWSSIRHKANKFNLKKTNNYKKINKDKLYKEEDEIIYKLCKCCRRYLPLEANYFAKDMSCNDDFRGICKECCGENFVVSNAIKWTEEDINILIKEYPYKTNRQLIEQYFPNRKEHHINDKAYKLNLHKTQETMAEICKNRITTVTRFKISETKKIKGNAKGKLNPMYGSHRVGELNPNWNGGLSSEKERIMRTDQYKEWRHEVYERDNYTCQCCGEMTHDVEAHHLDNFADFKDKRFDVENGITLCKSCHNPNQKGSFHNTRGTLHNTKEQFEEYLKYRKDKDLMEVV